MEGKNWCPVEWADYFKEESKSIRKPKIETVSQVIDHLIDFYNNKKRFKNGKIVTSISNAKEYRLLKSSLASFTKKKYNKAFSGYFFKDIKEEFLNDYTLFLQVRGAENGNKGAVVGRLKKLHAVCSYANEKMKMPDIDMSVFRCVESKMKHAKFTPKTIPHEVIKKIEQIDYGLFTQKEQFHIDIFLFCFLTLTQGHPKRFSKNSGRTVGRWIGAFLSGASFLSSFHC